MKAHLRARAFDSTEKIMSEGSIERRRFLLGAGTAVAAGLAADVPARVEAQGTQDKPAAAAFEPSPTLVLTATEADFISAAVDTIIPADELS
jgi:gluconate 2-dehydrogenase gamma chain